MKKRKGTCFLLVGLLVLVFVSGCCDRPGVFGQISQSMNTINTVAQPFYGPAAEGNDLAQMIVAAALAAGPLAQNLQSQWCPAEADVKKLEDVAKSLTTMNKKAKAMGMIK